MAEIVYYIATTLDGFIADMNGGCPPDLFLYEGNHVIDFLEEIKSYEYVLMGGNTYKYGFQFGLQPGQPSYSGIKHIVFSKTLTFESNQYVQLIKKNSIHFIKELKKSANGKIWLCGGAKLAGQLLENDLIDKVKLKINPTVVGKGIPLFQNIQKNIRLKLIGYKKYENGVIFSEYLIS